MKDQASYDLWEARWEAFLHAYIGPLKAAQFVMPGLPATSPSKDDNAKTDEKLIKIAIEAFEKFAATHVEFFNGGFFLKDTLIDSAGFPPDHVLSQVFAHLSEDMHLLQQAALQRFQGVLPDDVLCSLRKADSLAQEALVPAIERGWVEPQTRAMAYYERMLSVRVVPYIRLALIGVPLTGFKVPLDLLSVPHEVGHYVFHNGRIEYTIKINGGERTVKGYIWEMIGEILKQRQFKDLTWLGKWAEEIFADIYGCLVAGSSIALSAQLRAEQSSRGQQGNGSDAVDLKPSHLFHNNAHHPLPYFRPEIYLTVLKRMRQGDSSSELKKRWERLQKRYVGYSKAYPETYSAYLRKAFGEGGLLVLALQSTTSSLALNLSPETSEFERLTALISIKLAEFVDAILVALFPPSRAGIDYTDSIPDDWPLTHLPKYQDENEQQDFLGEVQEALVAVKASSVFEDSGDLRVSWEKWREALPKEFDEHNQELKFPEGEDPWPVDQWFRIFYTHGWTTEGPGTVPNVDPGKP